MTQAFKHNRYDVIIIGARCAGAATGMLMARNGARVLIVDRETKMHDTLSTHALMRPAVTLLDQWGLLPRIKAGGTPAVRSTQFHYGAEEIVVDVKPVGAADGLYAPRRWLLDAVLRDAAVTAGAELHTGVSFVSTITDQSGRVVGAILRQPDGTHQSVYADMLIGADGRRSIVAQSVGARTIQTSAHRSATVYTYVDGVPNQGYRWYFGAGTSSGLIPTTNGAHCLFTSCTPKAFHRWFGHDAFKGAMTILSAWEPDSVADLGQRGAIEKMRRFAGAPGHIRQCAGPGWALVGDAGYFKDPATAHGITDAFLDANRIAQALWATPGDARLYQAERDCIAPVLFDVTSKIASFDWDYDTLKALHMKLSLCMKAEHEALLPELPIAA